MRILTTEDTENTEAGREIGFRIRIRTPIPSVLSVLCVLCGSILSSRLFGRRYLLPNVAVVMVATTNKVWATSVRSVESVGLMPNSTMYIGASVKLGVTL
jgi:hypothetical protein